jgi:acyl-CoA thioesterase-1
MGQTFARAPSRSILLVLLLALALGARSAAAADARREITLLAFGDSLTAGLGLSRDDAFPVRLEAFLRAEGERVRVVNAGVSGDTTAGGRARLGWSLEEKPDAVILELGANDGLRGFEPEETESNLAAMLDKLEAEGIPVLLAGMRAPPNYGRAYEAEFNAVFPRLAERDGVIFYPFFLEGVAGQPDLNQADGIHPNAEGVEEIVRRIAPFVRKLIAAARARTGP